MSHRARLTKQAIRAQEKRDGGRNVLARRQFNSSLRGGSQGPSIASIMHQERLYVFQALAQQIISQGEGGQIQELETGTHLFHTEFQSNRPTLMVISGTHGVEGYAGQDIQNAVLRQLQGKKGALDYNLIMVHGLNHWGMTHGQRFTEENIDLNRNFLDWNALSLSKQKNPHYTQGIENAILSKQKNPHYTQGIENAIQAARGAEPNWWTKAKLLCMFAINGIWPWDVKSHIMRGQYQFEHGFEFGGKVLAKEHKAVQEALEGLVPERYDKQVAIIDLHTGVGKAAKESSPDNSFILIVDDEEQRHRLEGALEGVLKQLEVLKEQLEGEDVSAEEREAHSDAIERLRARIVAIKRLQSRISQGGGKRAYHVTGSCMSGYGRVFPSEHAEPLLVTQEFATANVVDIFTTLITNGNKGNDSLIPLFYFDKPWWRKRTTEDGVALYDAVAKWVAQPR